MRNHALAFVVAATIAAIPLDATVLLPATLQDLVVEAGTIVCGRVADVRPQWIEGRRRIERFVTLDVEQYFKGDMGPRLVFRVPGGEVGGFRSVMAGAPVFAPGDRVVVFLNGAAPSVPHLVGLSQGVFRVARDASTDRALVTPPPVLLTTEGPQRVVRGDPGRRPMRLEEFGGEIQRILTAGAGRP